MTSTVLSFEMVVMVPRRLEAILVLCVAYSSGCGRRYPRHRIFESLISLTCAAQRLMSKTCPTARLISFNVVGAVKARSGFLNIARTTFTAQNLKTTVS